MDYIIALSKDRKEGLKQHFEKHFSDAYVNIEYKIDNAYVTFFSKRTKAVIGEFIITNFDCEKSYYLLENTINFDQFKALYFEYMKNLYPNYKKELTKHNKTKSAESVNEI